MIRLPIPMKVLALTFLIFLSSTCVIVGAAATGGKCSKAGQIQLTKGVSYVCIKSGKKMVWQAKSVSTKGKKTSTTLPAETYFGPTTTGISTEECKLVEASPERAKYGNIFVAFPPIGGNLEPAGTFKVVLIPIDWADLPGEANPLVRVEDQIKLFNGWFDTVSEGKVSFVWSTYDKYVRVPGSALTYSQARSGGGDAMAKAAIAAADPYVDFAGVRAVYFLVPKGQKVFVESSQAFKDLNLSAPITTNEGPIMNYALAGSYFDVQPKNYWSYWVHETGHMFKLPDLKYNWNNHGEIDIPVPIGPFSGFDMLSSQDGPARTLSSWLRWIIGWLPAESLYCQNFSSLSKTTIMLNPMDNRTPGIKSAMIKISPTKIIAIESRRPASYDCSASTNRAGVLVYIVDATVGHGEGTQTLVPPSGRGLVGNNCGTPGILDAILDVGNSVTSNGVTVKLIKSGKYDTVEISKVG